MRTHHFLSLNLEIWTTIGNKGNCPDYVLECISNSYAGLVTAYCAIRSNRNIQVDPVCKIEPVAAGVLALSFLLPSAPGEVGVYEGAIVLALFLLGVDPTTALACALFSHLIDIILPLILGGLGLLQEGESLPGLYKKLSNLN